MPKGGSAVAKSAKHASIATRSTPQGRNQALARAQDHAFFQGLCPEQLVAQMAMVGRRSPLISSQIGRVDHHGERPAPGRQTRLRIESNFIHHGHLGKNALEANIVSPVEPVGAHRHQQINAAKPGVPRGGSRRMPKQIELGRIGLARFINRNQVIAADMPIRERRGRRPIGSNRRRPAGGRPAKADRERLSWPAPRRDDPHRRPAIIPGRFNRATWPSKSQHLGFMASEERDKEPRQDLPAFRTGWKTLIVAEVRQEK